MYTTCAFCNGKLDGDGAPAGLGVGRRLAFDEWRGRLWVICPRCARWNLTPLDDRLERVEALARLARDGAAHLVAATEQVALLRWQHYELVRVGKPPRVELAPWRYGERLRARQLERAKIVIPLTVAAVGLGIAANVAAGGSFGVFVWNLHRIGDWAYVAMVGNRRVVFAEPPVCERCGAVMQLRAKHVQHARVLPDAKADFGVLVSCPVCHSGGAFLTGRDAAQALRQGLTFLNVRRASRRRAADAARVVDASGGPDRLIRDVARRELTLRSLRAERQLALEMAVDEQEELRELERQWQEAEELAQIADGTLSTSAALAAELERLKQKGKNQPDS